ncbi:MAG: transcriptional repressor LexA [Bacteriovoracales bacterium]|jgi:repressor LexA
MSLTENQKLVLEYIQAYLEDVGIAPTQREIKEHFNLKSYGSVSRYIKSLRDGGFLNVNWNERRGIKVHQTSSTLKEIPFYGEVAAGSPLLLNEVPQETIAIPAAMAAGPFEYYALMIKGDSMIEDGILDGDTVIIKKQNTAIIGQTVVCILENETTLKKYFPTKSHVDLVPANSKMAPIRVKKDFQIAGVLVGLFRNY